jgi:NADPH-dependent 2,4-dienoyl-CoA reductase/sulfur reductase-like enzyme
MDSEHLYLIVGGGLAGASAIEGIRERDRSGSILLLGGEADLPYDRPPLSKQLWLGKKALDEIYLHGREWYAASGVELELGRTAARLDPAAKLVVDDLGRRHRYQRLLLATGGTPRRLSIPGGDLEGVCYYRTLDDFRRTRARATKGSSAVVIGGGFIGCEIAAALCQVGVTVTMLFPEPYLGYRVFPPALGRFLQQAYREHGIRVLCEDVPVAIAATPEGYVTTTRSGSRLASGMVIAGIGIQPSLELARGAGLAVADGIVVNARLQSSQPEVYAAGDVASFPYEALGRQMRIEHWDNAVEQGRHAGRNLAGASEPYRHLPFFFSDLFEFGYEAVGEIDSRLETFADWQEENRTGVVYYLAEGRVRGAMMCNVWDKVEAARELVREGRRAGPADLRGAIR